MENIDIIENEEIHDIIEDEHVHGTISDNEENEDRQSTTSSTDNDDEDYENVEIEDDNDDEDDNEDNDDDIDNEELESKLNNIITNEIQYDKNKHLQQLTLNEMTRIIININEMINNNVLQIPINESKQNFIYDIIINDKMEINIKRPIDLTSIVNVPLNQLKINTTKLKEKLTNLFGI